MGAREVGQQPTVFIVDDDSSVLRGTARLMRSAGLSAETFSSAREFLRRAPPEGPSCLVLDVRMPGLSGLDLQEELVQAKISIPIVFITGHGNIPMSVQAMKQGAVDFLPKPFDDDDLLTAVGRAIERDRGQRRERGEVTEIERRVASLTPREREVLALLVTGKRNKDMGSELGTSEKTIKVHRGRVMKKMQAGSVAELVHLAARVGIAPEQA